MSPWHLDLSGHEELDAALLSRGRDDVPNLAVTPASETDPIPLEDLVPGQKMAHKVRHTPLLHLLDNGAVCSLTGDEMASDNLKSDPLLDLSLIPFSFLTFRPSRVASELKSSWPVLASLWPSFLRTIRPMRLRPSGVGCQLPPTCNAQCLQNVFEKLKI